MGGREASLEIRLCPHHTLEVVLLTEEWYVVSMSEDELKAGLGEEAAKVCTEYGLKEPPQRNDMLLALCPIITIMHRGRKVKFLHLTLYCNHTKHSRFQTYFSKRVNETTLLSVLKRVTCTIYSTWCIMICLVIPTLSLLRFIQSLCSLSNFFIYLLLCACA